MRRLARFLFGLADALDRLATFIEPKSQLHELSNAEFDERMNGGVPASEAALRKMENK